MYSWAFGEKLFGVGATVPEKKHLKGNHEFYQNIILVKSSFSYNLPNLKR